MNVSVERLTTFVDGRGMVWEPAVPGEFAAQQNCHVVVTEPGGIRGNHLHQRGTEIATARGPMLVRYRDGQGVREQHIAADEVFRFVFPPGCAHAFQNPGPGPNLLICFNTVAHDPANPDVVREELIVPAK